MTGPPRSLREIWREHIDAGDYERHMAAIGQAQANAELLADLFRDHAPPAGARLLFAGAGAGQCFDYFSAPALARYRLTFTDINPIYLQRLAVRLGDLEFRTVVDDIEATTLEGGFDLAIVILVLEHVDWRKAVEGLARQAARVFTVIQRNPAEPPPSRLEGSLAVFRESPPRLVDRGELIAEFEGRGFRLWRTAERAVADAKTMVGLDFRQE